MGISPEIKIELLIKAKEFNNKFFNERIVEKQKEIEKLEDDCLRLKGLISTNITAIKELKNNP